MKQNYVHPEARNVPSEEAKPYVNAGKGYEWDREKGDCVDIKDCNTNARCNQICIEGIGGYTCACFHGYRLMNNNVTCLACDNNTHGAGCIERCHCVVENAANETQTCDHVNGTCICKIGWEGICNLDIDECTRNTHRCQEIPHTGCHNTIGGYECSCLRRYVWQNNRCVEDTSNTSTAAPPPQVNETVVLMSVKLEIPAVKDKSLDVTATYQYFSNASKVALEGFYRQKMGNNLKRIVILSLAFGSLIVDYNIYILNTPEVVANLTVTNVELASGASVLFENVPVGVLKVKVGEIEVSSNPSNEQLCTIFQHSSGTCKDGYACKVSNGVPTCRKIDKDEYYLTTALAAGIPMAALMIGAIIVFICLIKKRATTDHGAHDNLRGKLYSSMRSTFHVGSSIRGSVVNRLNTFRLRGGKKNMHHGLALSDGKDDSNNRISWQISAAGLFPDHKFYIKRPTVEELPNPIHSVA